VIPTGITFAAAHSVLAERVKGLLPRAVFLGKVSNTRLIRAFSHVGGQ